MSRSEEARRLAERVGLEWSGNTVIQLVGALAIMVAGAYNAPVTDSFWINLAMAFASAVATAAGIIWYRLRRT